MTDVCIRGGWPGSADTTVQSPRGEGAALHWLWYTLPLIGLPGLEQALGGATPPMDTVPTARKVLAVAAHPDDLEYFCGGTLCLLSRSGAQVVAVIATKGELGGDPVVRQREQAEAAAVLGYASIRLLDFPDRGVRATDPRLLEALGWILAQEQPDLLLTFDPVHPFPVYRHTDHLEVARAVLGLWHGPSLLFHTRRPEVAVDITEVFPHKVAAFTAHRSQLPLRATALLAGWHLGRRSERGGGRNVEVFRT